MPKVIAIVFFALICLIILAADTRQPEWLFFWVQQVPLGDKLGHFVLFGVLSLLVNRALGFRHLRLGPYYQIGSLCVLSFALAEELSQFYLPNRTLDIVDAACDVLGVGAFTAITVMMMRGQPKATES